MSKKAMAGLLIGAVALAGGLAFAGGVAGKKLERAKQYISWKLDDALDHIDASDAQRKTAQGLASRLVDEGAQVKQTGETVRGALVEEWKKERPDANNVHAQVDRMVDEVRAFAHKAADAVLSFHATLSPQQRERALQKYQQRRARWAH